MVFRGMNEPNLDFWAGEPKQPTYFELYDHTARAIKSVEARLQVGARDRAGGLGGCVYPALRGEERSGRLCVLACLWE